MSIGPSDMKTAVLVPEKYEERLAHVVETAWILLKSRFLDQRHPVEREAPFQHYLGHILAGVGELFCTSRDDRFLVDLERRCEGIKDKTKYADIVCGFINVGVYCAIELKFKTRKNSAQDWGRIDAYVDVEALEHVVERMGYCFGRFFMITDDPIYTKPPLRSVVGSVFTTHHGAKTLPGAEFHTTASKGRENTRVLLRDGYSFEWEQARGWYFLELRVRSLRSAAVNANDDNARIDTTPLDQGAVK